MSSANPDFWEIPVAPHKMDAFASGRALWKPERCKTPSPHLEQRRRAVKTLREIVATKLTPRQRACVHLYFFEGLTQQEVAERLGISRRVVSQHLFGIVRDGRRVGGALKRMRKMCKRLGVAV
ncbi:MAG: sigma-70 family RNA polymerase sigma factor [Candidatus Poribacteria bacterium]|nr:sigma-70 family RNA polymerase sigma factor [Candidatus Poribacteria bacterium]